MLMILYHFDYQKNLTILGMVENEPLCSKPVSRKELFFQKLLAYITIFFVMTIVFCMVGILGYIMIGDCSFGKAVNDVCILFLESFILVSYSLQLVFCSLLLLEIQMGSVGNCNHNSTYFLLFKSCTYIY